MYKAVLSVHRTVLSVTSSMPCILSEKPSLLTRGEMWSGFATLNILVIFHISATLNQQHSFKINTHSFSNIHLTFIRQRSFRKKTFHMPATLIQQHSFNMNANSFCNIHAAFHMSPI